MLKYTINYTEEYEQKIIGKIKSKISNSGEENIFEILTNYQECYNSALEYFSMHLAMYDIEQNVLTSNKDTIREWRFVGNAMFDEGVNCLWAFFDDTLEKHGRILGRFKEVTGYDISLNDKNDSCQKELMIYRHNCSAHLGDGILNEKCRIHFSTPWIIIDRLRSDGEKFWREKLEIEQDNFNEKELWRVVKNKTEIVTRWIGITEEALIKRNIESANKMLHSFLES